MAQPSNGAAAGSSSKVVRSTHGRALLQVLENLHGPAALSLSQARQEILEILQKDVLAARLPSSSTGNNAFHLLMTQAGDLPLNWVVEMLQAMIAVSPDGLKKTNKLQYLPLHLYMSQARLHQEVIDLLLQAYPAAAGIPDGQGLIPLFLCVMRDDPSAEIANICKTLCRAYPSAPTTMNLTHSLPLHFAAKRHTPNKEILKILLRRHPEGARQVNDFGLLPLHCISGTSDDLEAVKMIYEAFPEGVGAPDRQGRLPLHIAVLAVGKDHSTAVAKEAEEIRLEALQREREREKQEKDKGSDSVWDDYNEDDDNDNDNDNNLQSSKSSALVEKGSRSRDVIRFLADQFPLGLVTENNFQAVPVDTVLEKVKPIKSMKKVVTVFGLYDDPPTARLLLLLHRKYSKSGGEKRLKELRPRHERVLRDLNWLARRDAMLVSFQGEAIPGSLEARKIAAALAEGAAAVKGSHGKGSKSSNHHGNKAADTPLSVFHGHKMKNDDDILKRNVLARLRRRGYNELIRLIVQWI